MRAREGAPSPARSYYPLGLDPESGVEARPTDPPPEKFLPKKNICRTYLCELSYTHA